MSEVFIYGLQIRSTGRIFYVGQTIDVNKRYNAHKHLALRDSHYYQEINIIFKNDDVDVVILEKLESSDYGAALKREDHWWLIYQESVVNKRPYEIDKSHKFSMRGRLHTEAFKAARRNEIVPEERRRKISAGMKGKKNSLGKTLSDETRLKMSQSRKGKKLSDEHRAKIKEARKRQIPPTLGKKLGPRKKKSEDQNE